MTINATGVVEIEESFSVKEFNDDNGWITHTIQPGRYSYRVGNINGWKPRQLFVNNEWIDVCGECRELEEIIADEVNICGRAQT